MNNQSLIPHHHQALINELNLMLRARYPLLYIVSAEEEPVERVLTIVAEQSDPERTILSWDIIRGWHDNGMAKGSPITALERIKKEENAQNVIYILKDLHPILRIPNDKSNAPIIREIKNLTKQLKRSSNCLIFISHTLEIPPEFQEEVTVIDFPLPNIEEIDFLINQLVIPEKLNLEGLGKEQLIKACQGLSRARIHRILAKALAEKQEVNEMDIEKVLEEKKQAIRQTGILEFYSNHESLKNVGGLQNLKQWVRMRKDAFTEEARRYGIPNPKGVLLAGIQGTGKSLSAKTIAYEWRLPLLRLDAGRLFGGIVGESENKVRQMIKIVEAISPCVLWMDEIDKAFGNISSGIDGDSGTSRRVFGSLITWMQEKTTPVFIVATANNVQILPAELLRKGRFDEIFFLNLPTEIERKEIFKVHLQPLRPARLRDFNLNLLSKRTNNFSGAEIEQVIIDGMHLAFGTIDSNGNRRDFTTEDILRAIDDTVPLAAIAREKIEELKQWAAQAGARTASVDTQLTSELKKYSLDQGISPLEVD